MRNEVMVGGILGLLLGGLVTFVLANEPTPQPGPDARELAPLQVSEPVSTRGDEVQTTAAHRPIRPGSERVLDAAGPAQS